MKKTFRMEELDCAHCAQKMQDAIAALDGVQAVTISFMTQKLTLEADDQQFDEIVKKAEKICRKIEPDCRIVR